VTAGRTKQRVFSGIQPTGKLHLGNHIGALSVWAANQARYDNIFCIVDLHALTIPETIRPETLRAARRELAALLLACGIDPARSALFLQSHVPAHAELAWLLACVTPVGWLDRMTQYKSKSGTLSTVGAGLLEYPVLQAADILLYEADLVPVGEDQRQHIELTRDIARRFHNLFGPVFTLPQPLVRPSGARIMGLDDPTVKMSKSLAEGRPGHAIALTDSPERIRNAVMGAVTDSGHEIRPGELSPGVANLVTIYEALSGRPRPDVEAEFAGQGYSALKRAVADLVVSTLDPIRRRYFELSADAGYLDRILREGADRADPIARATLGRVKRLMGLEPRD